MDKKFLSMIFLIMEKWDESIDMVFHDCFKNKI